MTQGHCLLRGCPPHRKAGCSGITGLCNGVHEAFVLSAPSSWGSVCVSDLRSMRTASGQVLGAFPPPPALGAACRSCTRKKVWPSATIRIRGTEVTVTEDGLNFPENLALMQQQSQHLEPCSIMQRQQQQQQQQEQQQ